LREIKLPDGVEVTAVIRHRAPVFCGTFGAIVTAKDDGVFSTGPGWWDNLVANGCNWELESVLSTLTAGF
jgi:hypothetical protein